MALQHLGQIGADMRQVDRLLAMLSEAIHFGRFQECQRLALTDGVTGGHGQCTDDAAVLGLDLELHLHRFQHGDALASGYGIALGYLQADQHASVGGAQGQGAGRCIDSGLGAVQRSIGGEVAVWMGLLARGQQLAQVTFDIGGVDLVGDHLVALQQVLQQVQVARDTFDAKLAQRPVGTAQGTGVIAGAGDQFGDQQIVGRADGITGIATAIHAQTGAGGRLVGREHAAGRARAAIGVQAFQIQAHLYGVALWRGRVEQIQLGQAAAGS